MTAMQPSMTTTGFTLEGYRITKNLGVVRGIVVRLRYDATEIMQGISEVLSYGTAVVVEREG